MKTIYLPDTGRVPVADAKRLIREAVPREKFVEVYAQADEHGNIVQGGEVKAVEVESSGCGPWLDADFPDLCKRLEIAPRNKWRPVFQDYNGSETHDLIYTITHDELAKLAGLFDVAVMVGEPHAATDGSQAAPESAEVSPIDSAIPVAFLATRQQILDAFGNWGFKKDWFNNLNDRRWLQTARKQRGQSQRGQVVEPLFCPFEVMQGLVKWTRPKNGAQRMSEGKGWQVLEHKFPDAYARFSIGDQRERTG